MAWFQLIQARSFSQSCRFHPSQLKPHKASGGVQPALLVEAAEKALFAQLEQVAPRVQSQLAARDYTGALTALAALREPVDTFFNDVMVNAEDPALRANRLALLGALHQQMNCVADISRLAA